MAKPGGSRTKLTEHAMDSMTCQDCNSKYMWITEFRMKSILQQAGFRKSKEPAMSPDTKGIHKRKNGHGEELFPICSNPECAFDCISGKSDEIKMVMDQLNCSPWRAAGLLCCSKGDVPDALMTDYDGADWRTG